MLFDQRTSPDVEIQTQRVAGILPSMINGLRTKWRECGRTVGMAFVAGIWGGRVRRFLAINILKGGFIIVSLALDVDTLSTIETKELECQDGMRAMKSY